MLISKWTLAEWTEITDKCNPWFRVSQYVSISQGTEISPLPLESETLLKFQPLDWPFRLIIYLFSIGSRVDTRRITWNRTGPERNPSSSLSVSLIFIRNRYCVSYCHSGAFIELNTLIWRHALATRSFCLGLWRLTKNNCVLTGILFFVEW